MGSVGLTFLGILLFVTSVFMMLLILVQRGKGGGLTGALGGMGGQSAFGAKAGDVFTRITVITAIIWITLCMITIAAYNPPPREIESRKEDKTAIMSGEEEEAGDEKPGNGEQKETDDAPADIEEQLRGFVADEEESEDANDTEAADTNDDPAADESNESDLDAESDPNESGDSDDDK